MTLGRQPLTIVEIDVDRCTLTYGAGACTAVLGASGERKCFNTFPTCQDQVNYDKGSITLRFAYNQTGLPKIAGVYPALQSVSTNPIEINLSGIDPRSTALGKRARINLSLLDFVDDDNFTDPYQTERVDGTAQSSGIGYDTERGRFFSKLLARSPYYIGRALRVKRGYVGDDVATMPTANYVISKWDGPDASGKVSIVAKDVLDLVDKTKAVAPAPSPGKLSGAVTISATTFDLVPAGIGNTDYPASGRVRIGREVMTFTRSNDTMTVVARGVDGTDATTHAISDVVQLCLRYDGERACDIINDLLTVQGPVNAAFVGLPVWQAEEDAWLGGTQFSATITEPTGIAQLVGELCVHGVYVWWNEITQEISFRVNRPVSPGETVDTLTDAADFIGGSLNITRSEDQRVSSVNFYHGMIDPTGSATDSANYSKLVIAADISSASANEYDESRIKTMYSRWFGEVGNDFFAAIVAERLVSRYRDTPTVITGLLDVSKYGIAPADIVDVTTFLMNDATGLSDTHRFQVSRVEDQDQRIAFRAESYSIDGRYSFWLTDPQADYSTATAAEKSYGAFWADEAATDELGLNPYVYF